VATEIICNLTGRETRVALVEGGRVAELHIDRGDDRGFVGNVYLGRVVRVLPGMQAAFVDVGLERAAFLYVGDIHSEFLDADKATEVADDAPDVDESVEDRETPHRSSSRLGQPPIQDLLTEGQTLVVQIAKDPIGTKGARVTTHVALPGRYLVFMPTVEHVGISRRIERDKERRRLRDFVDKHRPAGAGFIVRTVCEGRSTEALKRDMDYLVKTWEKVQTGAREHKAPALLHSESGLVLRTARDVLDEDVSRLVVDDREAFEEVRRFVKDVVPELVDRVQHYRGAEPVFDTYGVESGLARSLGRKVWLKSGGYLVIDQTEALMAIDVNSGKFVGTSSLEETTLRTNLEAVEEVVYQLRLRNMGGLIIIDFIDMEKEQNRDRVHKALEEALRKDKARTNVLRISELGLVEMTRKRTQEGLDRYFHEECPMCDGSGRVRSRATVAFEILRSVRREAAKHPGARQVFVSCPPSVADLLYSAHYDDLVKVERDLDRAIVIRPMGHFRPEQFEVAAR
jgi:ribonuclease G